MPTPDSIPTLALSMGDATGIGPEIIIKSLRDAPDLARRARIIIHADERAMHHAAEQCGCVAPLRNALNRGVMIRPVTPMPSPARTPGPLAEAGRMSFACVESAIESAKRPAGDPLSAQAIVTAPISKEAWHAAGIDFPGHTELLASRFASPRSAMLFVGPTLRVILVTIHIPLREVASRVTEQKVYDAIDLGAMACRDLGIASPRIAVAGINPHAGERGLFGDEDDRLVRPAVERARREGLDVIGPVPGDAVFLDAVKGKHDLVVAMYHDQGLIPMKLLDRAAAVNVTTGLRWNGRPVVRTSPAHGTANDIAGKNLADPSSMIAAIELALRLCRSSQG